ncbi:GRB10-interacting GYF protein 1 isoform X3 [Rhinatrema bivittatum]|uniref:GRB10-interacting GYF protein 1 isoform X3 n=1 Tax=Rhinatrema bivittatum TaxID=194408 RepID=UPI001127B895|nr:GRB10-interacting GYF protein 1 isoform X3 [Rhinatrema bivittatum]
MAAETLNFGPEWLRALSSGGSITSPPPSPAMPKYKLAEYRYGREEMLALYVKDNKVPEEMQDKEFAVILQDEPLQPLALVPLTEEEQRNFSMSVNSVAVLRLMGKSGGPPPGGVARGRGSTRGRGRGRGESGFYQRSIEDGEGAFGRGSREIHRSQSWDDRGERRFEKPSRRDGARVAFDETSAAARKEFARSDSDNWRTLREEQEDDEEGSWRLMGVRRDGERWHSVNPDAPRSAGWREHSERRRKFDFDFRERDEERGTRRNRSSSDSFEEDKDGLPEWCMDDEDDEMGTFDSSGAFMSFKKSSKEPIPEEQELDFQGLDEEEERLDIKEEKQEGSEDSCKENLEIDGKDSLLAAEDKFEPSSLSPPPPPPPNLTWVSCPSFAAASSPSPPPSLSATATKDCESALPCVTEVEVVASSEKELKTSVEDLGAFSQPAQLSPGTLSNLFSSPVSTTTAAATEFSVGDNEDDDGMKHLQQEAEKLVASLQDSSLEEEHFTQTMQEQRNTAAALPLSHEAAMKWFYKDPQGEIQGPFTTQEMAEWFHAGYFTMSLLVKRGCDEGFQPLGEVIKMWGRVPFAPGPSPPPLLGNMDQDRLKKQQELAAAALYQQLQHQQFLQLINSRQQYAQCALQQKAASGDLTPQQQQQLTVFLQQLQALKTRSGEQGMIPSMNRSMSVPDTGSLWDMHTSASQPTGSEASLWDLPINSSTQGPILEQLQLQHKLQERRDAELRAKREEEERKRREEKRRQEEQKRREEEELFRRKQCRQQQELLLKLLQHSQQQSSPPLWSSLSKQNLPMKALLELQQQENERQLQKQQRVQPRVHGGLSMSNSSMAGLAAQWGSDSNPLWATHEKSSSVGLWEESLKTSAPGVRSMGLKNSRSSPSLSDSYGVPSRPSRKKTDDEEKLLKLLQGIGKPQDGFTQWCEQMLHALNTSNNLDVPTFVSFLKEVDSPYDVHDYIRSYLGDTLEAKEFAKQFLERRAKQKANQQRQQQQQQQEASWISHSSLQSMFQANHTSKQPLFDGSQVGKMKKRPVMLHADPSILGYSLHSSSGELETVEDY